MKGIIWITAGAIGSLLILLIGFEAYAVIRARARTPMIIAQNKVRPITLAQVGKRHLAMLLRVEGTGFFHHRGVGNVTPGQGRTTMTQALVKRLYFDGGIQTGFAKVEQSLIARYVFDPAVPKRDQLEMFLNLASFGTIRGRPVIGFENAALTFHGKPIGSLDDRQFLSLIAMLEALVAGRCKPRDLTDVSYEDCPLGWLTQRMIDRRLARRCA
ncbi:transglycosylase domain-containing protein [Sphingomonas sp. So64.6b]|uniref:transglycosylase domain-containing protein n=1 Tax=Sphingomonas sp. So64.6b TaxID=2997354 RepID=UPI0015FF4D8C|nr:transglycosylase domain-containing protein [Sphingomonas sp. So64.6b]QNA84804.1 transglycosylase domain-containing protein [Sphingomonas sp. So64.6b]